MVAEKKKTIVLYCLLAVALVGILSSTILGVYNAKAIHTLQDAAGISPDGETQEDNVGIMNNEYRIVSTLPISDAYKSGNTASLSNKQKETLEMASAVLDEIITEDMSDYEKEKAVYEWMTTELTQDWGVLQVIPQTGEDSDNPYGVLKYHDAVCVGYATTFRLFMQMMDIECMVVHNPDKYHSWNLVKLDGNWYHVDTSSDQGETTYANFNMNDDLAAHGHDWDREFFPAATSLEYNYAYQNRKQVEDIYQIPALFRASLDEQQATTCLGFQAIDEAHAQIVEAMLNSMQDIVNSSEFGDLWMSWTWTPVSGSEYILTITTYGFTSEDPFTELSEEDLEKVDKAVRDAFDGMSGDPSDNDTEGFFETEAKAVG
ncbi:MAG: hypothetical protein HFE98_03575 [Ruminiclostridium sp.]|nr:hypothetical protein [Ruminiclostridium sp.]